MAQYGATGQKPASARRNLATVGVLITVGLAALALVHVQVSRPPLLLLLRPPCARFTLRFLCLWV